MSSKNKFNVYWFGRPWSVIQLKNAALYSDKIIMTPLEYQSQYINDIDPYTICCMVGLEKEIKSTINVFENAEILETDDKVFDPNRRALVGGMLKAESENEELNAAITKIYKDSELSKGLKKVPKFLSEQALKTVKIDDLAFVLRISLQHAFYMGLIGAIENDAYPLTDDEIFTKILQLKSKLKFLSTLNRNELTFLGDKLNYSYTALKVINLTVPAFEMIPPENIIEIRDNEKQSLEKFRNEMYLLNRRIENLSKDPSQVKERIDKEIENKIIPRINDLESAIENSYYDFVKKLGRDLLTLSTAFFVGYSINTYAYPIALGGSTPLLTHIWQYLIDKARYKRNSLYYLIRVKEITKKYTI